MKRITVVSMAVLVSAILGFTGVAFAQKKHAPKAVWGAMVGGLNDIQKGIIYRSHNPVVSLILYRWS